MARPIRVRPARALRVIRIAVTAALEAIARHAAPRQRGYEPQATAEGKQLI